MITREVAVEGRISPGTPTYMATFQLTFLIRLHKVSSFITETKCYIIAKYWGKTLAVNFKNLRFIIGGLLKGA